MRTLYCNAHKHTHTDRTLKQRFHCGSQMLTHNTNQISYYNVSSTASFISKENGNSQFHRQTEKGQGLSCPNIGSAFSWPQRPSHVITGGGGLSWWPIFFVSCSTILFVVSGLWDLTHPNTASVVCHSKPAQYVVRQSENTVIGAVGSHDPAFPQARKIKMAATGTAVLWY